MKIVDGRTALANHAANRRARWNVARTSNLRSDNPEDAANRIHDGFADIHGDRRGSALRRADGVFAMGSCFAREIERHLRQRGARVLSIGEAVRAPVFLNAEGRYRDGFFNRFNPISLWQEFAWCFDALDGWGEETLILANGKTAVSDLNYWTFDGADRSREATLERRRIARADVRRAADAKLVAVTLGMTEAWFHRPSGFYVNRLTSKLMARRPDDFELRLVDHGQTVKALEDIRALLRRVCRPGVHLVVTVSPVPLDTTFTEQDIVVANAASKATLRAAAATFCDGRRDVSYFPSYELVTMSKPKRSWRADRIHVHPALVAHVVERFVAAYYESGALAPAGGPGLAATAEV
jgi:hypothetical protein